MSREALVIVHPSESYILNDRNPPNDELFDVSLPRAIDDFRSRGAHTYVIAEKAANGLDITAAVRNEGRSGFVKIVHGHSNAQQFLAAKEALMADGVEVVRLGGVYRLLCVADFEALLSSSDRGEIPHAEYEEAASQMRWTRARFEAIFNHVVRAEVDESLCA